MKTLKSLIILSIVSISTQALSYVQVQQEPSSSYTGPTTSQTFPTTTVKPIKDTGVLPGTSVQNFSEVKDTESQSSNSAPSTPQFGVRDLKVSADGKCKIGSTSRVWAGSPCAKVYGPTAPTQATSSSSGASTSKGNIYSGSIYEKAVAGAPLKSDFLDSEAPVGINKNFAAPAGMTLDESSQTYEIEGSTSPTSTYSSSREAFY
jgi:hypothetical protein